MHISKGKLPNNRFDLATLCHDSCEGWNNSKRATYNMAARIAPLSALQVKPMLVGFNNTIKMGLC